MSQQHIDWKISSDNWQKFCQLHIDENARLKAEVERLTERNKFLEQIDSYLQGANENAYEKRCDELEAEVERLRKAGIAMGMCLPDTDEANKAYRDFEAGGKS